MQAKIQVFLNLKFLVPPLKKAITLKVLTYLEADKYDNTFLINPLSKNVCEYLKHKC